MWKDSADFDYPKPVDFAMKTQQREGRTFARQRLFVAGAT